MDESINERKLCPHCQLPLALFNINIQSDGAKIYFHNICNKEIKREPGTMKITKKPCPKCNDLIDYREYENGVYQFFCKCGWSGAGGFGAGGGGGIGGGSAMHHF